MLFHMSTRNQVVYRSMGLQTPCYIDEREAKTRLWYHRMISNVHSSHYSENSAGFEDIAFDCSELLCNTS